MENPGSSLITYMHTLNIYFLCILKKYWMNTESLKYFKAGLSAIKIGKKIEQQKMSVLSSSCTITIGNK